MGLLCCSFHTESYGEKRVDLKECLEGNPETELGLQQLIYHMENDGATGVVLWSNMGRQIAYRSRKELETFLRSLSYLWIREHRSTLFSYSY